MGTAAHEQVALLTDYDAMSQYVLAYQNLFTNIRFDWDQDTIKPHTITFVTPTEHKPPVMAATNVAIIAAQNGIPTVLIDADLHGKNLHKYFGIQEQQGLGELLREDKITPQSFSQSLSKTFIPTLSLVSAGSLALQPVEISRLLAVRLPNVMNGLRQYLETNESRPSLIILHSPPMSHSVDAALISSIVDQTFLLIIMGRTRRNQVLKAQQQLEHTHAKPVGIILLDA